MTKTKQKLVSFIVGGKIYGIDLSLVQEFIENIECTQLPCTHNFIVGVVNLRGKIITVSDMGLIFEEIPCKEKKLLMVMRSSFNHHDQGTKTPIAFIVDQNGPIVVLKEEELVNIPDFSKTDISHLCSHAVKTEKGMLSIINPEKLYKVLLNDCQ
jgi:chemotaxis signal transduction protein